MEKKHDGRSLRLRIRLFRGEEAALGPGRVELLERIVATRSMVQAARDMELSYMKAWKLVQSMNRCFREPLVELRRGGKDGGAATLTATGERVLRVFRDMEKHAQEAARLCEEELTGLFAPVDR